MDPYIKRLIDRYLRVQEEGPDGYLEERYLDGIWFPVAQVKPNTNKNQKGKKDNRHVIMFKTTDLCSADEGLTVKQLCRDARRRRKFSKVKKSKYGKQTKYRRTVR